MMTSYSSQTMTMDPNARAPAPGVLATRTKDYRDTDYLADADPLTMLRVNGLVRDQLRRYDEECVYAARMAGATWEEVGDALGMARQNAQRKYGHLPQPRA